MTSVAMRQGSLTAYRLAALAAVCAAIYGVVRSLPQLPGWVIALAVTAIAWPIWIDLREHAMFERRAMLAGTTREGSGFRRWLWKGQVTGALRALSALMWATVLLAFGHLLSWQQWVVVAADSVALAFVIGSVNRWLASHVLADHVGMVARRWPLRWMNIASLTLLFMVLDFALVGSADTREMTWHAVADQAWAAKSEEFSWAFAGGLIGALAAADALVWHTWQILIPQLADPWLKGAAWILVLLQAGVFALALTRLQLGVCSVVDQLAAPRRAIGRDSSKVFVVTVLFAAVVLMGVAAASASFDVARLKVAGRELVNWTDPCKLEPRVATALKVGFEADLEKARAAAAAQAHDAIDQTLEALFGDVEHGVDRYLDWYFTVVGQYERLGAAATGGAAGLMERELQRRLFDETRFDARIMETSRAVSAQAHARLVAVSAYIRTRLERRAKAEPCRFSAVKLPVLAALDRDAIRASTSAVGGLAAGVIASGAASRAMLSISRSKAFEAAAKLVGNVVGKRAGTLLTSVTGAAAVCALTGPAAPVCAVVVGTAVWIGIDKVAVKIDEALFRETMRSEILVSVGALKNEMAQALKLRHLAEIDHMATSARSAVDLRAKGPDLGAESRQRRAPEACGAGLRRRPRLRTDRRSAFAHRPVQFLLHLVIRCVETADGLVRWRLVLVAVRALRLMALLRRLRLRGVTARHVGVARIDLLGRLLRRALVLIVIHEVISCR
jgi:hypothetical protein